MAGRVDRVSPRSYLTTVLWMRQRMPSGSRRTSMASGGAKLKKLRGMIQRFRKSPVRRSHGCAAHLDL